MAPSFEISTPLGKSPHEGTPWLPERKALGVCDVWLWCEASRGPTSSQLSLWDPQTAGGSPEPEAGQSAEACGRAFDL